MTAAQKTAKDKFKKAIAYRQKTGVSLKEAFAHIYGKKVGGTGNTYSFKVYDRNDFNEPINNSFRNVNISASSQNDAKDKIYKKFPSKNYFIELMDSYSNKIIRSKKTPKTYIKKTKKNIDFFNIVSGIGNIESSVSNILGVKVGIKKINNIDAVSLKLYDISNKKTIVVISIYNTQKDIKNEIAPDFSAYIFKNTRENGFTNKETETINKKILNYCNGILQEVKNLNKNVVKAVTKKVAVKKPVPKKKVPKKKAAKKVVKKKAAPKKKAAKKQYGFNLKLDKLYEAQKPGKRTSASGNTYYESRPNRSDKNKFSGIGNSNWSLMSDLNNTLEKMHDTQKNISMYTNAIKNKETSIYDKSNIKRELNNTKKYFTELKTHFRELKKLI